ncbi:hypothetical protein LPJ61_003619 [Coemansia biformis]|uniref:U2 snRNP-associated SURP motif-containing protein n=1 Tax=Coemansia biformis TaxID=1286918 RepID=A0A9W7YDI2_9FUNG|nr:hypothetical protein LPJ61_003619 [Coemansia biformis]
MLKRKSGKSLSLGLGLAKKPPQQSATTEEDGRLTGPGEASEAAAPAPEAAAPAPEAAAPAAPAPAAPKSKGPRPSIFAADDEADDDGEQVAQEEHPVVHEASGKRKRNLDTFLEELKRGQDERQERKVRRLGGPSRPDADAGGRGQPGQHGVEAGLVDDGDTTNLYVGSLHPSVDEQALCVAFAKFGPIGSVKIMWPRSAEEHARQRNSGFVSFMDRVCAEEALRSMDGAVLGGYTLRVSWGRRVPIPAQPVMVLDAADSERQPVTGYPFNAQRPGHGPSRAPAPREGDDGDIAEVHVQRPLDHRLARLIHWTVEHVIRHGPTFECLLIARTADSPRFRFLTDYASPTHVYYRWRMYSLLNGDTKAKWHGQMFFMYDKGPIWVPPRTDPTAGAPVAGAGGVLLGADVSSSEAEEEAERSRDVLPRDVLGQRARGRLERRVQRVRTHERGAIADAMASAIEHAYAPGDVVDVVCGRLTAADASPNERLARLLLVSDILHNCLAPVANAWRLREAFEGRLREVFDCLVAAHRSIEARLKAEHYRKRVLAVLAVWEAWALFPQETTHGLAAGFL